MEVAHLCQFSKMKCSHEEGSVSSTIYGGDLGYGNWTQSILNFGWTFQLPSNHDSIRRSIQNTKQGSFMWLVMPFGLKNVPPTYK